MSWIYTDSKDSFNESLATSFLYNICTELFTRRLSWIIGMQFVSLFGIRVSASFHMAMQCTMPKPQEGKRERQGRESCTGTACGTSTGAWLTDSRHLADCQWLVEYMSSMASTVAADPVTGIGPANITTCIGPQTSFSSQKIVSLIRTHICSNVPFSSCS